MPVFFVLIWEIFMFCFASVKLEHFLLCVCVVVCVCALWYVSVCVLWYVSVCVCVCCGI